MGKWITSVCLVVASWGLRMHQLDVSFVIGGLSDWGRVVGEQDLDDRRGVQISGLQEDGRDFEPGVGWGQTEGVKLLKLRTALHNLNFSS